jgi:hypothetical protein
VLQLEREGGKEGRKQSRLILTMKNLEMAGLPGILS